jgi:hypothetical protein
MIGEAASSGQSRSEALGARDEEFVCWMIGAQRLAPRAAAVMKPIAARLRGHECVLVCRDRLPHEAGRKAVAQR